MGRDGRSASTGRYGPHGVRRQHPPTFLDGGSTGTTALNDSTFLHQQADLARRRCDLRARTVEDRHRTPAPAAGHRNAGQQMRRCARCRSPPLQSGGTAINGHGRRVNLGTTLANTFQINATVSGARVAMPVRWSFSKRRCEAAYTHHDRTAGRPARRFPNRFATTSRPSGKPWSSAGLSPATTFA